MRTCATCKQTLTPDHFTPFLQSYTRRSGEVTRTWRLCSQCKTCVNTRHRNDTRAARLKCIEAYGGHCVVCSENDPDVLTFDHVNNDGKDHRKELGGKYRTGPTVALYRWAVKHNYPNTLQLLCWNCNYSKHRNKGVIPARRFKCNKT
jgi:hypothetical protein